MGESCQAGTSHGSHGCGGGWEMMNAGQKSGQTTKTMRRKILEWEKVRIRGSGSYDHENGKIGKVTRGGRAKRGRKSKRDYQSYGPNTKRCHKVKKRGRSERKRVAATKGSCQKKKGEAKMGNNQKWIGCLQEAKRAIPKKGR